jgi:SHS2 domain-containing protein
MRAMEKGAVFYELIDHTADMGVCVRAASLAGLFENAAAALFDLMTDISRVQPSVERTFTCRRDSSEELLVEWLGGLLYVFDTERIVFSRFSVERIEAQMLVARAGGENYDADRHEFKHIIKAVTYHNLSVRQAAEGYEATVIFDV